MLVVLVTAQGHATMAQLHPRPSPSIGNSVHRDEPAPPILHYLLDKRAGHNVQIYDDTSRQCAKSDDQPDPSINTFWRPDSSEVRLQVPKSLNPCSAIARTPAAA